MVDALTSGTGTAQPPSPSPLYIGIDIGTSGIRACAINDQLEIVTSTSLPLDSAEIKGARGEEVEQDPAIWQHTLKGIIQRLEKEINLEAVCAIAIDGTSGTVCLTDDNGVPVTTALMYNDARATRQLNIIRKVAPENSPVNSVSAALPKILWLAEQIDKNKVSHIMHQADWLAFQFTRLAGHSDVNNCLKTGYDPLNKRWPDWLDKLDIRRDWLPRVHESGEKIATIHKGVADKFGFPANTLIISGTTDSNAAVIATGVASKGDAVTSLGSTLVTKVISNKPIFFSEYGIYSQPFGDRWLVGGASNSGGAVLRHFFTDEKMKVLSEHMQPENPTGLDYYPLLQPGERFPINDPKLQPRLTPRPQSDVEFFQGLLEGIANIEHEAYLLLNKLGAPYPTSVRTVGGGVINQKWTQIRAKTLNVDMLEAKHTEAAYGSALLARQACFK